MASDRNIEEILRHDVERTHRVYKAEAAILQRTVRDAPSGIPYPDSVTRIKNAADSHDRALSAYRLALQRFNDYHLRRIVPDDLKA